MSKPIARFQDTETCSNCPIPPYTPVGNLQIMQAKKTYVNGRLVSLVGDGVVCGSVATVVEGSAITYCEGKAVHRLGDRNSCGVCITGSPDAYCG